MTDSTPTTIGTFRKAIEDGELTAAQAAESYLARIEADETNAFISTIEKERVMARADAVDRGEVDGPLAGVPVAIKDNLCMRGVKTTAASHILENFVAPYDATAVEKLESAGAIIVGKTNLDEFAMGSSNENSFFGPVKNPVDESRVPGGSSGGSAAAVAGDLCIAALGSDTGGSIRQPAAHCGVVGMKPTYGRVSRFGLIAFASSLDQIGPLTNSVEDAARLLDVIAGPCKHDMTSMDVEKADWIADVSRGVDGMKLGIPREYFALDDLDRGLDPEVADKVKAAIDGLEAAGAEIVEVGLPHTEYAVATYYLIATAEASSNLARFDGIRYGHRADASSLSELYEKTRSEGFGPEVKRRIMLGTYVLSAGFYDAYYRKAQQVRTLIKGDFDAAFETVDAIVTPTTPTTAFKLGEKTDDPLQMYLEDIYTISCNLAGLPGLSVPCGTTGDGMPVGLQVLAPVFDESSVFRVGGAVESL